jgi:leucyl-tRNA synthetase
VYRVRGTNKYVSAGLKEKYEADPLHVDVNLVDGYELDTLAFTKWRPEYAKAEFELEDGKYICGSEVEKMSKSKFNTVNPDDLVAKYGADTFRMYEMFLGPVEMSKPWDTKGIEGVHRFLKKCWRLFYDLEKGWLVTNEPASAAELKVLHHTIRKIESDTERFSFNTAVSQFMIAVNELTDLNCYKREILLPLLVLLQPYAPHFTEELYSKLEPSKALPAGKGLMGESFPLFDETFVKESSKKYPVAINGKTRQELELSLDVTAADVEAMVRQDAVVLKWMEGRPIKKVIYVPGKMINVVG